jgi:ketosteroid isomerase-like protein
VTAAQNVETVRQLVGAFNSGGIDAASAFFAPEVEFHEPPEQPAPRVARGAEETRKIFAEFDAAWEQHDSQPEEIRAVGEDAVLLLTTERFRGRDGIEIENESGALFVLREGLIVHWLAFWDRGKALKAAADLGA